MLAIEIITHFAKEDKECGSDYYSVDVKVGGKIVRHYNDHYHDKGAEKSEAFVDGLLFSRGDNSNIDERSSVVKRTNKASGKT